MRDEKYQFENLLGFPTIQHAVSTKVFGSMRKVDNTLDYANLEQFRKTVGISERVVCMQQVHGGNSAVIEDAKKQLVLEVDALITDKKGIPLAVVSADCLPIMFYDPEKQVISVVHAGYKGLLRQIIKHTLDKFRTSFKSNPRDIIVGIGPAIETKCYEVGEDVIKQFEKQFPSFQKIYTLRNGSYFLDLRGIALQCLLKEGILKEHVEISQVCTKCEDNLFSYRGGDMYRRFVSVISLK